MSSQIPCIWGEICTVWERKEDLRGNKKHRLGKSWPEPRGSPQGTGSSLGDVKAAGAPPLTLWGPGSSAPSTCLRPGTTGCSLTLLGEGLPRVGPIAVIPPESSQDQNLDQSCAQQPQEAVVNSSKDLLQLPCRRERHRVKGGPTRPSDIAFSWSSPPCHSLPPSRELSLAHFILLEVVLSPSHRWKSET